LLQSHTFPVVFGQPWGAVEWFGAFSLAGIGLGLLSNALALRTLNVSDPRALSRTLLGLYGSMVLLMAAFAVTPSFWWAAGVMLLFDMLRGLTFPLSETFVNQFVDSRVRATVLSFMGQVDALGQMSGGPIIGWVGRISSIPVAIITAAGILSATVPLLAWLGRVAGKAGGLAEISVQSE
jgi:hypothetical protein